MCRGARGAWAAAAGLALTASSGFAQTIRYVDDSAPPGGDGTSWATAFNSIHAGLATPGVNQVRVGQGTYAPAGFGGSRTATFTVGAGIILRGGYAGFGAANPDDLDPGAYVTTLTGDLNSNDTPTLGNRFDNSFHVVTASGGVVDGFLITAGNADSSSNHVGAGLFIPSGSPAVVNCTFYRNQANETASGGGAIASFSSASITVTNCDFIENSSKFVFDTVTGQGGAIFAGQVALTGCTFTGNKGNRGGAVYTTGPSSFSGCDFTGNNGSTGGAVYLGGPSGVAFTFSDCDFTANTAGQGGAVNIFNGFSSTHFTECVFRNNSTTTFGGGINALGNGMSATRCIFAGNAAGSGLSGGGGALTTVGGTALITNCTIAYNTSSNATGGVLLTASNSTPSVRNCILWGNTDASGETEAAQINRISPTGSLPCVNYSDVKGLATFAFPSGPCLNTGNIDADPGFADALAGDFSLEFGSPCIDAGDPSVSYNDPDGSRNDMGAVRVQNAKPVADAVVTQLTSIGDNAMIRLDATGSSDPDGVSNQLAVEWIIDGTTVCSGTFATCGMIDVAVAFGVHSVELIVTDAGSASDDETTAITVSPASLALLSPTSTKVDFATGEFRIQGEIAPPSTVGSEELDPAAVASVAIAGTQVIAPTALAFQPGSGANAQQWLFSGPAGAGLISRFDIDWGGARLRFRESSFPITLTSDTITSSESILAMTYRSRRTGAFSLTVGPAVINVDAAGNVTANVPVGVIDAGREVAITLPFTITPATSLVFSGGVNAVVSAADYLTFTTGTFRIDGTLDTSAFPDGSSTSPRSFDLNLLVGTQGYAGSAAVNGSDLNVRETSWIAR